MFICNIVLDKRLTYNWLEGVTRPVSVVIAECQLSTLLYAYGAVSDKKLARFLLAIVTWASSDVGVQCRPRCMKFKYGAVLQWRGSKVQ